MSNGVRERIGDYEILEIIGDGAQGKVYRAQFVGSEGPAKAAPDGIVALKVMRFAGDEEGKRERFHEQAERLTSLSHTSIVRYHECQTWHPGEWDEAEMLAMEYLSGQTLDERLKDHPAGMPWPQVKGIFESCLAGLIYAASRGLVHRDIKPSNIFLTDTGEVKLIDFDIARHEESSQASTVGWKGTFDYMSPDFVTVEGFRGDEQSDVFSLAVCFYQTLTGKLPFEPLGNGAHIGYMNRWHAATPRDPSFKPGVYRVLSHCRDFVRKGLQVDRAQRFQSFSEMLTALEKIRCRVVEHKGKESYELVEVLGRGGFGEVFKAIRKSDGKTVAVKYLYASQQSERFIKEALILRKYTSPALVQYLDFIEFKTLAGDKQFFLVLEFLDGMPAWTLRNRIKANRAGLPAREALQLFSRYLLALQMLHENPSPIIHIKPGNLYAPDGHPEEAKIFDLGVARDVSGTATTGSVPGTIDYMAPEFVQSGMERGSPQSDLYAIGLCLYEALTGKPAYERLPPDLNSAWLKYQQRSANPPPVDYNLPVFSYCPRLQEIVAKALAHDPRRRYATARDMRSDLDAVFESLPEQDAPTVEVEHTMATLPVGVGAAQAAPAPAGPAAVELEKAPVEAPPGVDVRDLETPQTAPRAAAPRGGRGVWLKLAAASLAGVVLAGAGWGAWRYVQERAGDERRLALATAENRRLSAERLQKETALRVAQDKAQRDQAESARLDAEKRAADQEKARIAAEAKAAADKARLEAELKAAQDKMNKDSDEKARLEVEKKAAELKAAQEAQARLDAERKAAELKAAQEKPAALDAPRTPPAPVAVPAPTPPAAGGTVAGGAAKTFAMVKALTLSPDERQIVEALKNGTYDFAPADAALAPKVQDMLAAARSFARSYDVSSLPSDRAKIKLYQARVQRLVQAADGFGATTLGREVREAAWNVMHDRMLADATSLLRGEILRVMPRAQSQARRAFVEVLALSDLSSGGRVAGCPADDPLRKAVSDFFSERYFHKGLLETVPGEFSGLEERVPWIKALFDNRRGG